MNSKIGLSKVKSTAMVGFLIIFGIFWTSCKKFLEVTPPDSKIPAVTVFEDDDIAVAAVTGVYIDLYSSSSFAGGGMGGMMSLGGLSSDELKNNKADPQFVQFQNNAIDSDNPYLLSLWSSMYKTIYGANSIIEGLASSTSISPSVMQQLQGEVRFIRAFCYFYLINIFGDVPMPTSTNYDVNSKLHRIPLIDVYDLIKSDLNQAEELLSNNYPRADRIRPNKFAATALLARVYLYTQDWPRAEDKASAVIANSAMYNLESDLSKVFLATSAEAIWQLRPVDDASYTNEGYTFSIFNGPNAHGLQDNVLGIFEPNDKRKTSWINSLTSAGKTIYLPYKYKRSTLTGLITDEYSMVLRLSEVYIIRAEARLKQGKISSAIDDIDKTRVRAGLSSVRQMAPNIDASQLMSVIVAERRVEFLAEWAHRWFDLKRWGIAKNVLTPLKPAWKPEYELYPIPASEILLNLNLNPQNPGY